MSHSKLVVTTRPKSQNNDLTKLISRAGFDVIALPMLELLPVEAVQRQQAIDQLTALCRESEPVETDVALFISSNAVHFVAELIAACKLRWPANLVCAGIGAATCRAIESRGWRLHPENRQTGVNSTNTLGASELLLQQRWAQQLAGKQIVIFRGVGGRELIASTFQQRGARVNYIEVYRRVKPRYSAQKLAENFKQIRQAIAHAGQAAASEQLPIALFASGETLDNFMLALGHAGEQQIGQQINYIVPSRRVADIANEYQLPLVHIAESASDQGFLRAILALQQ